MQIKCQFMVTQLYWCISLSLGWNLFVLFLSVCYFFFSCVQLDVEMRKRWFWNRLMWNIIGKLTFDGHQPSSFLEPTHTQSIVEVTAHKIYCLIMEMSRGGTSPGYPWLPSTQNPHNRIDVYEMAIENFVTLDENHFNWPPNRIKLLFGQ